MNADHNLPRDNRGTGDILWLRDRRRGYNGNHNFDWRRPSDQRCRQFSPDRRLGQPTYPRVILSSPNDARRAAASAAHGGVAPFTTRRPLPNRALPFGLAHPAGTS